jgi:SAM-dependent methyltransferase
MPQFTFRTELLPWSFLEGLDGGGRCLILGVAYPSIVREAVERLNPAEVVVVETSHEALETEAKALQGAVRVKPVFTRVIERVVELPSNSFDLVIAVNSLERAMQKRGFMTEVRRLLKEGGRAIIVTRLKTFFRRSGVGKEELEKLLNTDGFRLVRRSLKRGQAVAVLVKAT